VQAGAQHEKGIANVQLGIVGQALVRPAIVAPEMGARNETGGAVGFGGWLSSYEEANTRVTMRLGQIFGVGRDFVVIHVLRRVISMELLCDEPGPADSRRAYGLVLGTAAQARYSRDASSTHLGAGPGRLD
jgi:hypothetical protein